MDRQTWTPERILMGMFNLATQLAPRLVPGVDLTGCRTPLDLGGGPADDSCRPMRDRT